MAEGFFHDDAGPTAVFFLGKAGLAQLLHDGGEKAWRDRQIEKLVALGAVLLVRGGDLLLQALVGLSILEIPFDIVDALGEPSPDFGIYGGLRIGGNFFSE